MMDRIAIYSCIIGAYDKLKQPAAVDEGFDFICFVGKGEEHAGTDGVWQIRELPLTLGNKRLDARYAKMHPHELLPEYACSIWIDGNIEILDGTVYDAARKMEASGALFAGVTHPTRDCTYQEAKKCRDMRYISYFKLVRIWLTLAFAGLPLHAGLFETNVLFRRHNDAEILALDDVWWDKILHFCFRDQLSVMWCLRKCGVTPAYFLPKGQNTRNHPGFRYILHDRNNGK